MAFMDFMFGKSGRTQQTPTMTPGQMGGQNQALMMALQGLGGNKFDFAPIESQARTQFQTQTIPSLAERFTSMGGGQHSSAFQGTLGQAGAGLEQGLASLKSQYGLQQQGLLQQLLGMGLQPQFENTYFPSSQGFIGNMAGGLGAGLGGGLGGGLGALLPLLFGLKGMGGQGGMQNAGY